MASPDSGWAHAVTGALDILDQVAAWHLTQSRWARVEALLDMLTAAVRANDLDRVRHVTVDLELVGPSRITRIGAVPVVPAPRRVRDRTNRLVHLLGAADTPSTSDGTGAGDDRRHTD